MVWLFFCSNARRLDFAAAQIVPAQYQVFAVSFLHQTKHNEQNQAERQHQQIVHLLAELWTIADKNGLFDKIRAGRSLRAHQVLIIRLLF